MRVLGGDWPAREYALFKKDLSLRIKGLMLSRGTFSHDLIPLDQIESADLVTQQNQTSVLGKMGWGAAGAIALGPLGLLAGVLGGGNRSMMVMAIKFKDGRKVLLEGKSKEMQVLLASTFTNAS